MGRKKLPEILNPPLNTNHTARLDSLRAVRIEMCRLYRAAARGRLPSDELTRFVYALKEIRMTLESEIAARPLEAGTTEINILPIPTDHYVMNTERTDAPRLEYREPVHVEEPVPAAPPVQEILPPEPVQRREPELVDVGFVRESHGMVMRPPPKPRPPRGPSWDS